jgi:CHAT domain-containing protein/Tfp pilus assembly protein PilF
LPLCTRAGADDRETAGVAVERVAPRSVGAAAGLEPGDVILSWSSGGLSGSIRSPYDLLPVEIEEAPRRAVTLRGKRGDEERIWTLRAPDWGIETRPAVAKAETGDGRLAAWFLERSARAFAASGQWSEADAAYQEALAALEREPETWAASQILIDWGKTFERRSAWDAALERYRKALTLDRGRAAKSLAAARTLNALGVAATKKDDYAAAEGPLREALAIQEELAPGSVDLAATLNNLGALARARGDFAAAEADLERAEEIDRRLAPDSAGYAQILRGLGNLSRMRGDLERAERLLRQALALFEAADPIGEGAVGCLQNLSTVAILRGDHAAAEGLLRRGLALTAQRKVPNERDVWSILINLGHIATERGELEAAEVHYRGALAIQERISPNGADAALTLSSLGGLALLHNDLATARTYMRRAQEISERLAPGTVDVAIGLENLAHVETDAAEKERLLRRSLAIFEREAPQSLEAASTLRHLGEIVAGRGRLREAIALQKRAVEIQRRLRPESSQEAATLFYLGRAERRAGRSQEGTRDLCLAVDVLDRQRARLGGTPEAKTAFESTVGDTHFACLDGLIALGRSTEAFHVLERGRARSFLALLAERDLRLADLPPALAAERRRLNGEYDRVQSQLAALQSPRDGAEIQRLQGELQDLRTRQEEILARMRRESPHATALQNPEPLGLAGARAALDPGTVLLEYAVGPERTWGFVVRPGANGPGLSVFRVRLGAKSLRGEVEAFRLLLKDPASDPAQLAAQARRLYDLLVRPADARIAGAQRLLVSPDGPLHTLPFAALLRGDRFLVERKPIHSVLSATVYAELAGSRPSRRGPGEAIAAFGDPVYPRLTADGPADPAIREAVQRGWTFQPLPFSGQEVKDLAALYPQTQVYLGRDATEERAKSVAPQARLVHFACHGLLDERFPLNSGLALTLPEKPSAGQDNGLLQAWEIFESVRLDADLVTLSACDTALGREMAGEGLVGLTRAFQYAGARSVLATLWGVADRTTALFMKRFYGYLRQGRSKDEALRAAQADLIRSQGFSHPYYWAAFQLTGDWR